MTRALRILMIDDSEDDALLILRALRAGGYLPTTRRVWTPDDVRAALTEPWDLVISDWAMPNGFTGLVAYQIVRELEIDVPYIIVSGTISEEIAVDALKAGVHDFINKERLARLIPAIERELRDAAIRARERVAEEAHARAESMLRDVIATVPYGIVIVDTELHILKANSAAFDFLGAGDGTIAGWLGELDFFEADMVTPIGDEDLPLMRALRGESIGPRELFVRKRHGRDTWLMISARPLSDGAQIHGAFAVFRDITEEKAQQQRLMMSDRMASIGMLAAGVAHELNNPLAAVLANVELASALVAESETETPAQRELVEMLTDARTAADRVRHIVRDLKIFSRHEDPDDGAVDLRRTLESTVRMAWNEIRHRATLEQTYAETPLVKGSESRLGQVFLNLIVNAAQAIPEGNAAGNRIRIASSVGPSGDVLVEVSDTGAGISPEARQKLFLPFFTTKPQGEGTGLGLAISHRIVTGLGGSIEVDSEPGRGTTFRVRLPCAIALPARPRTMSRQVATKVCRLLVVDDEPMIPTAVRRLLPEHQVRTTTDAREALELLRANEPFDMILCDLMMPQMTGMDLHAAVMALDPALAERMVFMTGDAFTVAARAFLDQVPNPRIEKPFDRRTLRALIDDRMK